MKINKEQIMEVVNNPKNICWSDVLENLNLIPLFQKYKKEHNKTYSITQIFMGKTLIDEIENILKYRIVKSKDKRVRAFRETYRLSKFAFDSLNSCPTTAKEDIDYMELKDL